MGRAQPISSGSNALPASDPRWWPSLPALAPAAALSFGSAAGEEIAVKRTPDSVMLAMVIAGAARIVSDGLDAALTPGGMAIIATRVTVSLRATSHARIVILHLPRSRVELSASAACRQPRLLRPVTLMLDGANDGLQRSAEHFATGSIGEQAFAQHAVDVLQTIDPAVLWRSAKALGTAIELLLVSPSREATMTAIAKRAGISEKTLQRGLRACTGLTLTQLVAEARLARARAALSSPRETRPIGTLALANGFGDPSSFARLYRRRFGEAPSLTRARSVGNVSRGINL